MLSLPEDETVMKGPWEKARADMRIEEKVNDNRNIRIKLKVKIRKGEAISLRILFYSIDPCDLDWQQMYYCNKEIRNLTWKKKRYYEKERLSKIDRCCIFLYDYTEICFRRQRL
jgi:hypothetical protein